MINLKERRMIMSKAEKFIQDYTRKCSNEMESPLYANPKLNFYPWLTPEQALRAVEIEREELLDKACEWLEENKDHPLIGCEDPCLSGYLTSSFIENFKKYMKGE